MCEPLHLHVLSAVLRSALFRTPALIRLSDIGQTEDMTMRQSSQLRERKPKAGDQNLGDLDRSIKQLRETLGVDQPQEMTTAYLAELRAAVEVVGRAIKEEQWAREGYTEFLGE
jgi:hypothetical protein